MPGIDVLESKQKLGYCCGIVTMSLLKKSLVALAATTVLSLGGAIDNAHAEATISAYGGFNFSPHSRVKTKGPAGNTSNSVGWDGASFSMPPYWGVRGTYWLYDMPQFGIAVDFTHAKVKADPLPTGFSTLEFTDGINFLTANALYRHDLGSGWTPYGGVGLGLSVPHVEVAGPEVGGFETLEYQVTGFAAQALIGVDYEIDDRWSVFSEFKSTYGQVDADLKSGYSLDTDIISNQVILGVTFKLFE